MYVWFHETNLCVDPFNTYIACEFAMKFLLGDKRAICFSRVACRVHEPSSTHY